MSAALAKLRVVPVENESSASINSRLSRRAYLAPETLRSLKLVAGEWVHLNPTGNDERTAEMGIISQLWPRSSLEEDEVALSDSQLVNLNTREVDIRRFDPSVSARGVLKSVTMTLEKSDLAYKNEREQAWIRAATKEALVAAKYIRRGFRVTTNSDSAGAGHLVVKNFEISTKATSSRNQTGPMALADDMKKLDIKANGDTGDCFYEMDWRTKVFLASEDTSQNRGDKVKETAGMPIATTSRAFSGPIPSYINLFTPSQMSSSSYDILGGLDPQIKLIKSLLDLPLLHPSLFSLFGLTPPRGILLHGPPGTGKTALARAVASSTPGCSCIVVNGPELSSAFHGETEERLRGVFDEAKKRSPCIIVLDEVDALCPRRDGDGGEVEKRVVATLLTLMDGMGGGKADDEERVFVIAATNRPNVVDPALRRPGRFDREIEIGIPDVPGRRAIIEIMISKMPHTLTQEQISAIAARTHGFVGADLSSLIRESASLAIQRWHGTPEHANTTPQLTESDILHILPTIRPSAMREVFVETPTVRWWDIGGQEEVKQKLRECVEWPLKHAETFSRLGVEAPKGVLLYGPPGCSKTMTAKALATESGINFIAVKGPELLNKYVGESERAVREIFRKARAASPSIIFFDEIDALGSSRSEEPSHSGVLTSLLNEMDGIEELSGVTVVAATNRPDILDSALMRPGRLDRILYVGAPDLATRKEIFRIRLGKMAVEPEVDLDELAKISDGCSGAEVASICQDAALTAMNEDLEAPYVKRSHLFHSAKTVRRRITPSMLRFFEEWRDQSGVRSA